MESINKNMNVMHILFYVPDYVFGGIRTVTEILSREFKKREYEVYWLHLKHIFADERDFHSEPNCYFLPSEELFSVDNIRYYQQLLEDKKIDVVINQHGLYEGAYFMKNTLPGVKVLHVIHSNPIQNYNWLFNDISTLRNNTKIEYLKRFCRIILYPQLKYRIKKEIQNHFKQLNGENTAVVVLSPSYVDVVRRIAPKISNIIAIPNPNTYSKAQINSDNKRKEKIVLFVGRLDNRSKKLQYLLKIWEIINNHTPEWRLVIIGDGPDKDCLEKMSKNILNVTFLGFQDPLSYYKKASIFCLTSIFEGFPMCITEAMQNGCVPIAFNSFPAVKDLIQSGFNGELIETFDIRKYAEALLKLMMNPQYRETLSINAQEFVRKFDVENIIERWESVFYI